MARKRTPGNSHGDIGQNGRSGRTVKKSETISKTHSIECSSIVRGVALLSVVLVITGFLVYPDVTKVIIRMQEKGISGLLGETTYMNRAGRDITIDIGGSKQKEANPSDPLEMNEKEAVNDDSDVELADEDGIIEDVHEESILFEETGDLMEDEVIQNEKEKNNKDNLNTDKRLNIVSDKGIDAKKRSSKPLKSNNDLPVKQGRPGRDKNAGPTIVLKPGSGPIKLDPSQIRFVDKPSENSPKVQNNKNKHKPSASSEKSIKSPEGIKKSKSSISNDKSTKEKVAESSGKGNAKVLNDDKKIDNSQTQRSVHDDERLNTKQRSEKTKEINRDSDDVKIKSVLSQKIPDTEPAKKNVVKNNKAKQEPLILNEENDKIVIDPSTFKHDSSDNVQRIKVNKTPSTKSSSKKTLKINNTDKHKNSDKNTASNKDKTENTAKQFKARYQKTFVPKKVFIDGRRIPPSELVHQKESNSSVKVYLFNDFLSDQECDGLIKAHDSHLKALDQQPILCFDSITTLRKHLKDVNKSVKVTPNDFTQGTRCLNSTFSSRMQGWLNGNWSYSTAFYPGESKFSNALASRIEQAMGLGQENGGKFQITSYPIGKAYKEHTDCTIGGTDKRDRMASVLMYLNDVEDGGETAFPDLGIWVKPRKGRALLWNNMSPDGFCEPHSKHVARVVKKGSKYILIRWYYYKSFMSLGKRQAAPQLPTRHERQPVVTCDEYNMGSCRWYDEWTNDVLIDYQNSNKLH